VRAVSRRAEPLNGLFFRTRSFYVAAFFCLLVFPAHAQNSTYAAELAASCTNCHASTATGAGDIPVIAGRDKEALLKLLTDFKTGARPATVMHQLARGFTTEQLEALAAYFASVRTPSAATRN
jgi:sulfide dehydrogenase cytochrome subunit